MKLSVILWRGVCSSLDDIRQKDLPTVADVRKCIGLVGQIKKALAPQFEKYDTLKEQGLKIMTPYTDKLKAIGEAKTDKAERERQKLVDEANKALAETNGEIEELDKLNREEVVDIEVDGNYRSFFKAHFETLIRPKFVKAEDVVAIADAFEI